MKKFLVFISAAGLLLASCGSKPKVEDPVQEQIASEVSEAVDKIEEKAEEIKETTDNSSALAATEAARQAAISAGADKVAPDQLAAADALYKTLEPQAKSGVNVSKALEDLKARYEALEKYAKALEEKTEIEENKFQSFDQASYNKGNEAISGFSNVLSASTLSGSVMLEKADTAYKSYFAVLFKAYKSKAKEARTLAFKAKTNADSVKAGVAAKKEYTAAVEEFRSGDSSLAMQNPKAALGHYEKSAESFTKLYEDVKAKREATQKAMDEARAAVEQSKNYAVTADKENPLKGDDIEGIEKEDTVLLEEEKFEDPKESEAKIDADIDVADPEIEIEKSKYTETIEALQKDLDAASKTVENLEQIVENPEVE